MRTYRAWRISVIAFGCIVALGCPAIAQTMTKITVGSATVTTTPLGATYSSLPIALFWKQEGLDVKYVGLPGANAALQALIAGTVDVVPGTNSALFAMYQKYPDAKVVAFFTHTTAFNSVPVVLKDSSLKTIRDLEGKNVGVQSLANSQVPVTKALVTLEGGDAGKLKFIFANATLATAYEYDQPVVTIVMNNKSLQIERELMERKYGRSAFVDYKRKKTNSLWGPDFPKLAEAMGAKATRVEKPDQLVPAVRKAVESGEPYVVDVDIDLATPGYRSVWYPYPADFWKPRYETDSKY